MQIPFTDTLFDTFCKSQKTISFLHRSYIIPISFFRFLYHFYITENFHGCRHYIVTISFFRFLHHCYIEMDEYYINSISLRAPRKLSGQNKFSQKIGAVSRPNQNHTYISSLCTISSAVILILFISLITSLTLSLFILTRFR